MIGVDFDILEINAGGIVGIDHDGAFDPYRLRPWIDQKQTDSVALAGLLPSAPPR